MDEDRTVIPAAGGPLPIGQALQEFVIEGLVGEGGFGIVYLARDTHLGRRVALKEYMPSALSRRGADGSVVVRSERHRHTFELGLHSFFNEAQLLASFDHPSLVKVYRFWKQNGTAYMVMPYYQGPTLKRWLAERATPPDEAWLRELLASLTDALELIHNDHCYHRDVAPDNILLLQSRDGGLRPLLLDFGAARRVIGDATQALTVILKPGYAPIEQYAETASSKQGPWTDIYALCAVLYNAVTGLVPVPSVSRMMNDDLLPASRIGAGRYSAAFLAVIDAGLSVRPERRPQSVAALRSLLADEHAGGDDGLETVIMPSPQRVAAASTELPTLLMPKAPDRAARDERPAPGPAAPRRRGGPLALVLGAGLVVAAAGGLWALRSGEGQPGGAPSPPASAPSSPPDAASAAPPAPEPPLDTQAAPFSLVAALDDIVAHADPALSVQAAADKPVLTIGRDRLQLRITSSQAGYLYLFFAGTDKSHFYLLFPNKIDADNRIAAGRPLTLPRKGWHVRSEGPPGINHIVAMVSRHKRDLNDTGLRQAGADIPEFDLAEAQRRWAQRQPGDGLFVGRPLCGEAGAGCADAYGAAQLQVEEVAAGQRP